MDTSRIDHILRETLEDRRLSRTERKALADVLSDIAPDARQHPVLRARAFAIASEALGGSDAQPVLNWVEDVVKVLAAARPVAQTTHAEALFSPGTECVERIVELLRGARRTVDVCVFTITDDRISRALTDTHERGVRVRIVTDDDKAGDRGSDVDRLARAGIGVAVDRSEKHMHHKFAVFDGRLVLTGSYNWTRGAANANEENVVVTDDERLVRAFTREFESLWSRFSNP